jgi:type IV pilus assembly protein PilY1
MKHPKKPTSLVPTLVALATLVAVGTAMVSQGIAATSLSISQTPLTIATAVHPQVLIALGNSQSMDGTLSGAIMTGSGTMSGNDASLSTSSSPTNYVVPDGFVAPVSSAASGATTPYTVKVGGVNKDNGASRLNVAKGGVAAILQTYMQNTDFALATYNIPSAPSTYSTWVYYMSPAGSDFVFTNTKLPGKFYVDNPCKNYTAASSNVQTPCAGFVTDGLATSAQLTLNFMEIGASSDDPSINDVLYADGQPALVWDYGARSKPTPYPPNFSLGDYNNGNIYLSYNNSSPNGAIRGVGPTNAGYVPYSTSVMYAKRGFGYYGTEDHNTGKIVVPMKSSGLSPTTTTVSAAIASFTPYLAPETSDKDTAEIKASAVQAPIAGLLTKAKTYLTDPTVRTGSCPSPQYVVLISDGLPTKDMNNKAWPPLGSAAATGYGITASFNTDGSLNTTNNQALTDAIAAVTALKTAGIKTYVIGLGAGVDATLNPQASATLKAMAVAGGTTDFFPAKSAQALADDLNAILLEVGKDGASATAAAVNSTRLQANTIEFQASFVPTTGTYQDWTGNILATKLDETTGIPLKTTQWSVSNKLDTLVAGAGYSLDRLIATWVPNALPNTDPNVGAGKLFRWSQLSATQQNALQPTTDGFGSDRLNYLRGNTAKEQRNAVTPGFRNRSHILGDIVNSQAIYVGAPSSAYFNPSYFTFQNSNQSRKPMLYVGANDGMLHAFDALTGDEKFAFVPNGVFSNLHRLTDPLYNQNHRFFVDGSPQVGDVQFSNNTWHTLLVAGLNAGGRSVYALDITDPASITTEALLASTVKWEFTETDMGLSYSDPQIAPINATPGYAVFFGNGYNSASNKAFLYALNPETGAVLRKIDLCAAVSTACSASNPQGLSSVTVGNSNGLQGQPITQVYAGDLQGNLWAIDVGNATPSSWTVRLLFQARDSAGSPQAITTAPVVTLNPNYARNAGLFVMFGTGQFLTATDLSTTQTQSIYGVWDKPGAASAFTRTDLQTQTLTRVTAATSGLAYDLLTNTNNIVNFTSKVGWYDDLPTAGQRIFNNPQLFQGVFITSVNRPPVAGVCNGQPEAMLVELDYATGGEFSAPQFDINADGLVNSTDKYTGKNPAGIVLSNTAYGSQQTILLGTDKNKPNEKITTLSNGTQKVVANKNNLSRRIAWWQLQ